MVWPIILFSKCKGGARSQVGDEKKNILGPRTKKSHTESKEIKTLFPLAHKLNTRQKFKFFAPSRHSSSSTVVELKPGNKMTQTLRLVLLGIKTTTPRPNSQSNRRIERKKS